MTIFVVYNPFNEVSSKETLTSENKLGPITISITHTLEQETVTYSNLNRETLSLDLIDNQIETEEIISPNQTEELVESVIEETEIVQSKNTNNKSQTPFYSQFDDISNPSWRKVGCGIASLAMIIELYNPGKVSVDDLLAEGIESGAYLNDAGWIHKGLINLAQDYGLNGDTRDLSGFSTDNALEELESTLDEGPVMASVHYTFDPKNPIPHLVVINKIVGDTVYYNDPSEKAGNGSISTTQFLKAWKKRYIEIRPT